MIGVKIIHCASVKYATTMEAVLNDKYLGLSDTNIISILEKISAEILRREPVWSIIVKFHRINSKFADIKKTLKFY
jgi:hypothetical protein